MNVLVTGGAGFIGSAIVEACLTRGDAVKVLDNLSTGRRANLAAFEGQPNFEFIENTVTDRNVLNPLMAWCDHCYHLAAPVGVQYIMQHPVLTVLDNIRGIDAVLELANEHRKRVLVASTSEVYGKHLDLLDETGTRKLKETDYRVEGDTQNHRWAYANTKALDEFLALAYHKEFELQVVVVRFFNTVGPRQVSNYGMVIPNFVERALMNQPIRIFGTGEQKRSFMHVQDVVRAVLGLMAEPKALGEVFNVGYPIEISINDLAQRIVKLTGSKSSIVHENYEAYYGTGYEDMQRRTADITKLQSLLNFEIQNGLDEILRDVIAQKKKELVLA